MKVFVYGSLKNKFYNHGFLKDAKFITNTTTKDKYTMLNLGHYPALINDESLPSYKIEGELYEIDDKILEQLDMLEGYPHLYNRSIITLSSRHKAIIYYMENCSYLGNVLNRVIKSDTDTVSWRG